MRLLTTEEAAKTLCPLSGQNGWSTCLASRCALWEDGPAWIKRKVYHGTDEHKELLECRFSTKGISNGSFEFNGRRWMYVASHFDDKGEYDLIARQAIKASKVGYCGLKGAR